MGLLLLQFIRGIWYFGISICICMYMYVFASSISPRSACSLEIMVGGVESVGGKGSIGVSEWVSVLGNPQGGWRGVRIDESNVTDRTGQDRTGRRIVI